MADTQTWGDPTPAVWRRNRLLASVPEGEQERLRSDLRLVNLGMRDLLYEVGQPITHVYFPLDCVISVITLLDGEIPIEVLATGFEGMVGLPAFLGATTSSTRSFCQVPGQALRMDVAALRRCVAGDGGLHDTLLNYTQAVMVYLAQNVACNRLHTAPERCARWLAETHDRVGGDTFPITQDFLAQMLGVRRATVSRSARVLQRAGLISYSRGRITVLDRAGLHGAACACYGTVRREFEQLWAPPVEPTSG